MNIRIATHHSEQQAIVSIRDRRPPDDLPAFIQAAFPEVLGELRRLGIDPTGAPFVLYHEFGSEGIDAEVSVPVAEPIVTSGHVQSRVLPAMTVARTLHVGPYEQLADAYATLSAWVDEHGFVVAGPVLERYLNGPGDRVASTEYRTEIDMPIVPVAVAASG